MSCRTMMRWLCLPDLLFLSICLLPPPSLKHGKMSTKGKKLLHWKTLLVQLSFAEVFHFSRERISFIHCEELKEKNLFLSSCFRIERLIFEQFYVHFHEKKMSFHFCKGNDVVASPKVFTTLLKKLRLACLK